MEYFHLTQFCYSDGAGEHCDLLMIYSHGPDLITFPRRKKFSYFYFYLLCLVCDCDICVDVTVDVFPEIMSGE